MCCGGVVLLQVLAVMWKHDLSALCATMFDYTDTATHPTSTWKDKNQKHFLERRSPLRSGRGGEKRFHIPAVKVMRWQTCFVRFMLGCNLLLLRFNCTRHKITVVSCRLVTTSAWLRGWHVYFRDRGWLWRFGIGHGLHDRNQLVTHWQLLHLLVSSQGM